MMKPWMIKVIIGVVGFGGGFAAGFFCHKKMNDVKFEEITAEEMAAIESRAVEKQADIPSQDAGVKVTDEIGAAQKLPEDPDEMRNLLQGKKPYIEADNEQKRAYEKMWKATKDYSSEDNANRIPVIPEPPSEDEDENPEEEDFDEDFLEQIEQEAVEAGNNFVDPPHQIDLSDFYNDRPEYDKITIKYFEPDNTWIDDNDEVIADISSYIGTNRDLFKTPGMDDDPDVRFIRNDRYNTDYEIIRHHRSWSEETGE